jgi:hypothetical protein
MATYRKHRKLGETNAGINKVMKLIKSERSPAPTVARQMQTIRTYHLLDNEADILIIGDDKKGKKKGIAVYEGYKHLGYFDTLDEAKRFVYNKYG